MLTLGIVIEEYIRLIGSVKQAFQQRQRAFHAWHAAEGELQKRRGQQEKLLRQGRSQQDRLSQVEGEVREGEVKAGMARGLFEDMGRLMRGELDRFEKEKVEDFKSGVETFLESAVEAQKEVSSASRKHPFIPPPFPKFTTHPPFGGVLFYPPQPPFLPANTPQLIEKWETFLMQLDAEDDESVFYRPPVVQAAKKGGDTAIDRARARMDDDSD